MQTTAPRIEDNTTTTPVITGQDFVILSTQDWTSLPTRKHRFSRWWARDGNRVLYIEQQMHWAGWLADIRNQFSRAWRWLQPPREVEPNVWVYTLPIVLPFFQMFGWINWLNNLVLLPILRVQLKRLGFHHPVLWTYTPHSADFIGKLGEQAAIYEIVDDFVSARGLVRAAAIRKMEQQVIAKADQLIVTAPALMTKGEGAVLIPNGVETEVFGRAADPETRLADKVANLKHPVIGLLGALNYWIDTELLARIARKHPDWTILHVGTRDLLANWTPLQGLPNVVATGRVPYADLPEYVKAFDVCVNPYLLDGVAEHCSPLKLYEYVATGKPVVSVDMPEAHTFEGLIGISHSSDDFVALVEQAVAQNDGLAERRMAEAEKHTWRSRYGRACDVLRHVLERRAA